MGLLDIYGLKLIEYLGRGSIYLSDDAPSLLVEFECIQLHTSDIYAHIKILEKIDPKIFHNKNFIKYLQGNLSDGRSFSSIGPTWVKEWNYSSISNNGAVNVEGTLILSEVVIKSVNDGGGSAPLKYRFYLTNLRYIGTEMQWLTPNHSHGILPLEIEDLTLTIFPYSFDDKFEKEMCSTKACRVISYLETALNDNFAEEKLLRIIENLCYIFSFAKGTEISWPYYHVVNEFGEITKSIHRSCVTSNFGSWELIPFNSPDIFKKFVQNVYGNYVAVCREYELNKIIQTIVHSKLDNSFLELRALNASSATDVLRGRWSKLNKKSKILYNEKFKKCSKLIEKSINDLEAHGVTNNQIRLMSKKLPELNRPSLNDVLKEMSATIGANISPDQIDSFIKTRNKLVHEGCFATDNQFAELRNTIFIIDSLILKIIGYQGPYIDCRSWNWIKSEQEDRSLPIDQMEINK